MGKAKETQNLVGVHKTILSDGSELDLKGNDVVIAKCPHCGKGFVIQPKNKY